jgi:glycosyltransferase involved in cell wall biosynthesis
VVDPALFHPNDMPQSNHGQVFLMVASWAPIKRPLLVLAAFADILLQFPDATLRIVGYGHQWGDMQDFVKEKGLERNIFLLGSMPKSAIAEEMRQADGFVHASQYETFSVVCAEALCCGVPVITSKVGAIPEFVDTTNGILVDNTHEAWVEALCVFIHQQGEWNYEQISRNAIARFSPEKVGTELAKIYQGSVLSE